MEEQFYTIILRHDTSTKWLVNDPILSLGEYGVEDDTHKVKRGDGESKWSELLYEDFGLQYIVTFANLNGELKDNEILTQEFEKKLSKNVFDDVNNSVVVAINITNDSDETIGKISKTVKEIELGGTTISNLIISSDDKSIQGVWAIDEFGAKTLNLTAKSTINDYTPGKVYHRDYICYYGNKLYRAVETFEAEQTFNDEHWALLASLHSNDIRYDNLSSGLDSDTVKGALDELKRRDDRKVVKSTEERIVYGTNANGEQTVIPIDDLRKVDTVNHKQADLNKNVQLDANEINYNDAHPEYGTIRGVLDGKVDKTVAGVGAKIVRDIQTEYDSTTGHIRIIEDKVSLEDGTSATEVREIDVVSEAELLDNVNTINARIDTEVADLNDRIDDEVQTLNTTITTKEAEIYDRIQDEHDEINARVDDEVDDLNDRIDQEVTDLNATIDTKEAEIYRTIQDEHNEINTRVTNEVATLNNTIDTKEAALQQQIDLNASEINRVESERIAEETRIETESRTRDNNLAAQIANEVTTLNGRIDTEVATLNDTIDDEVDDLNDRIDSEVATLNTTINTKEAAMDNKKIDKDLSTLLVTEIVADTDASTHEPTMKITRKNTTTKESVISHLHFSATGNIRTNFVDADHIQIDSSVIDGINTEQNRRLGVIDTRLNAHDTDIASLQQHDLSHDSLLATHTSQIALHETRLDTDEANITALGQALETEATTRQNADNALSTRITTNAVNITTKADKEFADTTGDKVVGKLESDTIENDELFNLKQTMVSPVDNSSSVERLKIISSDHTVVATRLQNGTIDLATNLDTDVNYFIYIGDSEQDGLSDVIGTTQVVPFRKIVAVTKQGLELNDIVTDIHGVWGRVQSIDEVNEEANVITFNKSGDAAWGHIKGSLANQTDLQTVLTDLDDAKVDKCGQANQVYGTDNNGDETTFNKDDLRTVDTVNNIQPDNNKNIELNGNDIIWTNDTGARQLSIKEIITELILDLSRHISTYSQDTSYQVLGTFVNANFVTFTRDDGIMLMAKVLRDFTSDNTEATPYDSFMYDVEHENLKLVGIPEQQGEVTPPPPQPNWTLYTSVNINSVVSDDGHNPVVNVCQDTNNIYNVGFEFTNNSGYELEVTGNNIDVYIPSGETSDIYGFNLANDYTYYDNENAILGDFSFQYENIPDWQLTNTVTISSIASSDGENPIVDVYEDINGTSSDVGFDVRNDSGIDDLWVTFSNGQTYTISPGDNTGMEEISAANPPSYYDNENAVLEEITVNFVEPQPEPDWQLLNTVTIDSEMSTDGEVPEVEIYEDVNGVETGVGYVIKNLSETDTLRYTVVETGDDYDISPSSIIPMRILYPEESPSYYNDEDKVLEILGFYWIPEPDWQVIDTITISNTTSSDSENPTVDVLEDMMGTSDDTGFVINNPSSTDDLTVDNLIDGDTFTVPANDNSGEIIIDTPYNPSHYDSENAISEVFNFAYEEPIDENEQAFEILNDVMGTSDEYEGLGGTEEEIEEILNDVLGTSDEEDGEDEQTKINQAEDILWQWLNSQGEIGAETNVSFNNEVVDGNTVTITAYNETDGYEIGMYEIDIVNETVTQINAEV